MGSRLEHRGSKRGRTSRKRGAPRKPRRQCLHAQARTEDECSGIRGRGTKRPRFAICRGCQVGVRAPSGSTEEAAIENVARGKTAAWQGVVGPESRGESASRREAQVRRSGICRLFAVAWRDPVHGHAGRQRCEAACGVPDTQLVEAAPRRIGGRRESQTQRKANGKMPLFAHAG